MSVTLFDDSRYEAITRFNIRKLPEWQKLKPELQESVEVVSQVLPFRTNSYVTANLIDWHNVPEDPIYQLTFPQKKMLAPQDYETVRDLLASNVSREQVSFSVGEIQKRMNPHPAGQLTHNVPEFQGRPLQGVQHKYRETVLFFPAQGQTCHAYCSYCFRWPQFVGISDIKFKARNSVGLVGYLKENKQVTDVLVTGGDPMIMKSGVLASYLEPILADELKHIQSIRIGTKSLAYWPYRFVSDSDADEVLRLFERIVEKGRHLALMAHFSHPSELRTPVVRKAIQRVRAAGVEIRMQAPLVKHVNDFPEAWAGLWREGVKLGMIPYYMFVERDTGPKEYFEVPLAKALQVFRAAFTSVSGLARTVRGPSMSAFPGKVHLLRTTLIGRDKLFVLQFLQARDPSWVGRPFFAKFDPEACWLDQLEPAFGRQHFFFEREKKGPWAVSTVA